jgi:hypothetical protein
MAGSSQYVVRTSGGPGVSWTPPLSTKGGAEMEKPARLSMDGSIVESWRWCFGAAAGSVGVGTDVFVGAADRHSVNPARTTLINARQKET